MDVDLKVKECFVCLVFLGLLMILNVDNFQLVYFNKVGQFYLFYYIQNKYFDYLMMLSVIIDNLKKFNDYCMFYYVFFVKVQIDKGIKDFEWDVYFLIDFLDSYLNIFVLYGKGEFCLVNFCYICVLEGEFLMWLSYVEQNFILVEGVVCGWILEDVFIYYKKGIEVSMNFIVDNIFDKEEYIYGCIIM